MTASTPPAWNFLSECDVPVEAPEQPVRWCKPRESATLSKRNGGEEELSGNTRNPADSATLGVRNDSNPDPTYQDCWPSERYDSDPSPNCRCAVETHAPGCDVSGSPVISCDRKDDAEGCDEAANVTDSVINVESCPECGAVTDLEYGPGSVMFPNRESGAEEETFNVPFRVQEWMFESLCEVEIEKLHDLIDNHHDLIIEMARDRFRKGFCKYGSAMYSWSPERRLNETLQEVADSVVYPTSGPLE